MKYLLLSLTLMSFLAVATEKGPAIPDYPLDKITDNVFVIHGPITTPNPENQGFMNNPGIIVTDAGLVIIDPGGTVQTGEMVLRMASSISDKPVVAVFNTHVHGDHWLGNQAIKAAYPDVKIYGHPKMLEQIEEGEGLNWVDLMLNMTKNMSAGTTVVGPDQLATNGQQISVGSTTFRIHNYGKAHTETDLMIEVVEPSVVFLGDNVLNGRIPRISDGDVKGNIASIKSIMNSGAKYFVPGHGHSGGKEVPQIFLTYLETLYAEVAKMYDEGMSDFEMKDALVEKLAKYKNWESFDSQFGKNIGVTYLQVEEADF